MNRILGVTLVVPHLKHAIDFFCHALDFKKVGALEISSNNYRELFHHPFQNAYLAILKIKNEYVYLIEFMPGGRSYAENALSCDLSFQHIAIVVSDMEKAYKRLMDYGIKPISHGPQTIPETNKAAAGIKAFYFRSPMGHPLELIYYPEGKGIPHWQEKRHLVLGIDHTAIAVSDTQKSRQFYEEVLHLQLAGVALNEGITQERLSGVKGAKVQISGLRHHETEGVGLEFLHYLNTSGRSARSDLKAFDHEAVHTVATVDNLAHVEERLKKLHAPILSKGHFHSTIDTPHPALTTVDPDGHCLIIIQNT